MKMFKKLMAIALVGVMALSMLTGCAVTDSIKEKALRNALGTAASIGLGNGKTVTFKGDDALDKVAKKATENVTYADPIVLNSSVDKTKYAVVCVEIKKSTNTADEFEKGYAMELLKKLTAQGFIPKEDTNKVGVKFFDVDEKAANKTTTHYYVVVVAEKNVTVS